MAERTLIDAMARAIANTDLSFDCWERLDAVTKDTFRREASAALRALHDHGPTQRMLDAAKSAWATGADHCTANTARYLAMLVAELEGGANG